MGVRKRWMDGKWHGAAAGAVPLIRVQRRLKENTNMMGRGREGGREGETKHIPAVHPYTNANRTSRS